MSVSSFELPAAVAIVPLTRQTWFVDRRVATVFRSYVFRFSENLIVDMVLLRVIIRKIAEGSLEVTVPFLELNHVNIQDVLRLVSDVISYGEHAIIGISELRFQCVRTNDRRSFRDWLWTIWFHYTHRTNLVCQTAVAFDRRIGQSATHARLRAGESTPWMRDMVVIGNGVASGRWVHRNTGRTFVPPEDIVFVPYESSSINPNPFQNEDDISTVAVNSVDGEDEIEEFSD